MRSLRGVIAQMRRRSSATSGADFINRVLVALGRPRVTEQTYRDLVNELRGDKNLAEQFEKMLWILHRTAPHRPIKNWDDRFSNPRGTVYAAADIFYVLPRLLRPTVLVETGVAAGSTTAFLLAAMRRNAHGELLSFDVPPVRGSGDMGWSINEFNTEVGFLIPEIYKDRWSLTLATPLIRFRVYYWGRKSIIFFTIPITAIAI